ncbi:MAG: hypothetical protein J5822_06550 [Eubacteriaceae bacterium]|nr:hypothetical protein [Eubacteriaceae bacterium]
MKLTKNGYILFFLAAGMLLFGAFRIVTNYMTGAEFTTAGYIGMTALVFSAMFLMMSAWRVK